MRKTILSLLLAAGLHGAAQAQRSDTSLGLKAGGSLSDLAGADADGYESLFGFHAGVFANLGITRMVAFQPELLYSQKGAALSLDGSSDRLRRRLHYVDVPLAFHVNADGLFFEAGPQVGFLVGAQQKLGNSSADIKPAFNTVDVGYLAGLGYQRKQGLGIGLRYNGAFTNVAKKATIANVAYQDRARNSVFQLYLSYSLNGR